MTPRPLPACPVSRRRAVLTLLATLLLVIGACSGPAAADSTTASSAAAETTTAVSTEISDSEAQAEPPIESSLTSETDPAPAGVIDALTATGPVEADEVPDMTPVIADPRPVLPATVTDSTGKTITVATADRVIALDLYGTLTDTIIGLGLTDRLVGRGVSDTQAVIEHLPIVSLGGIDLNVEAVLDLRPDLVLTNLTIGSDARYQQLEAAGVTVVRFAKVPALQDIPATTHEIGAVFGMAAQADELAAHTTARLAEVRAEIARLRAATPREPRAAVLYVRGAGGIFFILGQEYGVADILRELGLDDIADANGITGLMPGNPESLVSLNPEIVLTMEQGLSSAGGVEGLLQRPGMAATTAGANERIITAADSQLLSYGPRTPDNLLALARAIYTDLPGDAADDADQ